MSLSILSHPVVMLLSEFLAGKTLAEKCGKRFVYGTSILFLTGMIWRAYARHTEQRFPGAA